MGENENQVEKAYRLISDMIFKYQLPPGASVSDFSLAKILGISRTPIRQAIMQLLSHGVIVATGNGYKVAEITIESIDDLYDARRCLESSILRLSMEKPLDKDIINQIRKEIEIEAKANAEERLFESLEHDLEFHRLLISLCKNNRLEEAFNHLHIQMKMMNVFSLAHPNYDTCKAYSSIVDAVEEGNTEKACKLLEDSIEAGRKQKKEAIEKFGIYGLQGLYRFIANSFQISSKQEKQSS